jgi:hypothetical protein
MPDRSRKRPTDVNELAKKIVDDATSDVPRSAPHDAKEILRRSLSVGVED